MKPAGNKKNILLVIIDTLRDDAVDESFSVLNGCHRADVAVSAAPWTLPSCTSIMTGNEARTHRHHWREPPLGPNRLVESLPKSYLRLGFVNNLGIRKGLGVENGFKWWRYFADFDQPFERALAAVNRDTGARPRFIVLHSNIAHDYYLPIADQFRPVGQTDRMNQLGSRVVTWRDTDPTELPGIKATYAACATAVLERVSTVLEAVRERDDFVTAVTADHGEGFDPDLGRVHHGGRMHQDLLSVPAFFDLPSTTSPSVRNQLTDALSSRVLFGTDTLPTLFDLAGVHELPQVDGQSLLRGPERTVMSEDRRYLYLKDRFRINYHGRNKNMSTEEIERNRQLTDLLAEPPTIRAFLRYPEKCVVTSLRFRPEWSGETTRTSLERFGANLLGSPILICQGDHLIALELFDLRTDPSEQHNRLLEMDDGVGWLLGSQWATSVTVPVAGVGEIAIKDLLEESTPLRVSQD